MKVLDIFQRRSVQLAVIAAGFIGLIVALAPYGLSLGLKAWLKDSGARQVVIAAVELNLFSARFAIRGLRIGADSAQSVRAVAIEGTLSQKALLQGRLLFDRLSVRNAELLVSQMAKGPAWQIGEIIVSDTASIPSSNSPSAPVGVLTLQIENSDIRLVRGAKRLDMKIASARVENLLPWASDVQTRVEASGTMGGSNFLISGTGQPYAQRPTLAFKVNAERLRFESLMVMSDAGANVPGGTISLDGMGTAELDGNSLVRGQYEGAVDGHGFSMMLKDLPEGASAESVSWAGTLAIDGFDGRPGFSYEAEGRLGATGLRVVTPNGYRVTAADARLEGVHVKTTNKVSLRAFTVQGLNVVRHTGPVAPSGGPQVLAAERVRARDVAFSDKTDLQVRSIDAEGARINFLNKDDIISGPHRLFDDGDAVPVRAGVPVPHRGKRKFNIRIGRASLTKGSVLSMRDESVTPAVVTEWRLDEAYAEDIDSIQADKPMRVRLAGKNRGYGSFDVHGHVNPFTSPLNLEIDARVDRIDLPKLTPYLLRHAGYVFKSGEGNLKAKIKIDKGRLDAQSVITLRAMEVVPGASDAASMAAASLAMPVEAALSLLRDKNNDIRLEIPVTGDPLNPQFSLGKVIAQAAAGTIKTASMGFLKYALQPYGAVLLAGELAQDFSASIRLDPVVFRPGKGMLEASHVDYLARVAKTLAERPALRIKLCGKAAAADRVALAAQGKVVVEEIKDQALTALATARAGVIKQRLVSGYEIDPGRIIACRPEIDLAPGAKPRAEFLI